jgi:short-subunit dehydrogenase
VNTASMSAVATEAPTMAPYICAKSAVLALSECLDSELRAAGERVGVSVVLPGPVLTRMLEAERNRPEDVPATGDGPGPPRVAGRHVTGDAAQGAAAGSRSWPGA